MSDLVTIIEMGKHTYLIDFLIFNLVVGERRCAKPQISSCNQIQIQKNTK